MKNKLEYHTAYRGENGTIKLVISRVVEELPSPDCEFYVGLNELVLHESGEGNITEDYNILNDTKTTRMWFYYINDEDFLMSFLDDDDTGAKLLDDTPALIEWFILQGWDSAELVSVQS